MYHKNTTDLSKCQAILVSFVGCYVAMFDVHKLAPVVNYCGSRMTIRLSSLCRSPFYHSKGLEGLSFSEVGCLSGQLGYEMKCAGRTFVFCSPGTIYLTGRNDWRVVVFFEGGKLQINSITFKFLLVTDKCHRSYA